MPKKSRADIISSDDAMLNEVGKVIRLKEGRLAIGDSVDQTGGNNMRTKGIFVTLFVTANLAGAAFALAQGNGNGRGNGGGGGGGGEDPPAEALVPAYAHTLSGRNPSIYIANRDFSKDSALTVMTDGRTRGMDHAPDEGRVLVEEFRALWETSYSVGADGSLIVTGRSELFNGEQSAAALRCIATGPLGAYAYSLTSAVGGELVIRTPDDPISGTGGQERSLYNVGTLDSCDFNSDGTVIAAIENLPGAGGHELVTFDVASGSRISLLFGADDQFSLDEVMVAPDGTSYLLGWTDRRAGANIRKVSEWQPGESLTANPVIASDAGHASFACDFNGNFVTDDGYVFQSGGAWFEVTPDGTTELIASKGNRDVYWLRPTC